MDRRSERLTTLLFENRHRALQQRLWELLRVLDVRSAAPLDTRWIMDFGQWPSDGKLRRSLTLELDSLTIDELSDSASKFLSNGLAWRVVLFLPGPDYRLGFSVCEPIAAEVVRALCVFPVEYSRCIAVDETMSLEWDVDERGAWEFRVFSAGAQALGDTGSHTLVTCHKS